MRRIPRLGALLNGAFFIGITKQIKGFMASMNSDIRLKGRTTTGRLAAAVAAAAVLAFVLSACVSMLPFYAKADSNTKNGSVFSSTSFSGADNQWSNPNNAASSDNSYATASIDHSSSVTYYLKATGFGFSIPAGSTINGIQVMVEKQESCNSYSCSSHVYDNQVHIVKNNTVGSTDRSSNSAWSDNDTTTTYGSPTDLWGQSWTASDINNSNFGFVISAKRTSGGDRTAKVDSIQVKVYYTPANNTPVATDGTVTTDEDTAAAVTLSATDADSDTLTYSIVSNPSHGTLGSVSGNQVTYTPSANYHGADSFTFKANDGQANSNTATVNVTVTSVNDLPVITLTGASTITVPFGGTYTELGATADDVEDGSDINLALSDITGSVDTGATGSYTVTYNFTDSDGGAAAPVTRTVKVVDQDAPVVTITPATQTVEATSPSGATASYTVTASDDVDGDVSDSLSCDHASGDTFPIGVTTVTCQATDSNENTGYGSATVTVVDTTAPVITLNGNANVTLTVGDDYTDAGATAADIVDVSDVVSVGGDVVDTSTAGTYTVTYDAVDEAGNHATQVTRTVTVNEPAPVDPTCSDNQTLVDHECVDNPSDDENSDTSSSNSGSNGGGGGGAVVSGPFSIGFVNTNPTSGGTQVGGQVLGTSTEATDLPASCSAYLTAYLKKGNSGDEVKKLQSFLNQNLGLAIPVTGYFGPLTFNGVKSFQAKYADDILKPWFEKGLSQDMNPSGYAYKMTLYKINLLQCATLEVPAPQLP